MEYRIPDYYKKFHCTADACEDTCCAGWQIAVDPVSMNRYRMEQSPYRWKLWHSIHWITSSFRQTPDKRCAFLNSDNLCDMYTHLGPNSLCRTCRLYPRHIEEFEGIREITLSISCPEVAKYLMNCSTPVTFQTYEKEGDEEYEDFDPFLYSQLADAREIMIEILQNRNFPIEVRSQLILGMAHDLHRRVRMQNLFACYEVSQRYQTTAAALYTSNYVKKQSEKERFSHVQKQFRKLESMERLRPNWSIVLSETKHRLYSHGIDTWAAITSEFHEWVNRSNIPWDIQKEQLLVYFLSTYFCGAVYDGNVYGHGAIAVNSTLLIEELLKSIWLRNEKQLNTTDLIEIVYRFSREIEHSEKNLKRMF